MSGSLLFTTSHQSLRFTNLGGSLLKVGVVNYKPFFIKQESSNQEVDGVEVQIVKEMARRLNFTYEFLVHEEWGVVLPNGSWKGGFGQSMQDGEVDIAMANIWQIPSFYSVVDFGPSLNTVRAKFLVLRPEIEDFKWQTALKIFKTQVWYCILISFVLVTLMYWLRIRFVHSLHSGSVSGSLLTIFGFFTMSTSHSRVIEDGVRIVLTSWSIFALLVTTSLSSGIVSSLTLPSFSPRIDTVQQLVEGKYYWTIQYYKNLVNNTEVRTSIFDLNNIWIRLFESTYKYLDDEEVRKKTGVDKKMTIAGQVYGNDFVILDINTLFKHKGLYNYRVTKENTAEKYVSFGVKKHSPLIEPLTRVTLQFLELGLPKHWSDGVLRRWRKYDTSHLLVERDYPTLGEPQPLQLLKLRPVFYFLLLGLLVSAFFCLLEMWWG